MFQTHLLNTTAPVGLLGPCPSGPGALLTTEEAAAWLTARGLPRTVKTLEALRVRGGKMAPPFRRFGRTVRYLETELQAWAEALISAPMNSTSEGGAR